MKNAVLRYLEKAAPLAVELETELCRRPALSPDSGGEGELDKCEFLEKWLRAQGITALERHDAPDGRAKGGIRPNLIVTIPGRDERLPRLWIISHLDVVPPGEASLWKSDPWKAEEKDEAAGPEESPGRRIIGRGTEDNQQGMISSILAALALIKQDLVPARTVKLLFAADEEMGSAYGIRWLLQNRNLFRKDDMALVPDGGDKQGASIEIAEKNLIWMEFTTRGIQTHGSRPDQGINAHLAGADLAVRLHQGLSETFSVRDPLFEPAYSTFEPTRRSANVPNINTIPGEDVFCMDMRVLPLYPIRAVQAEVDRIKAAVEAKYGVKISHTLPQSTESKPTPPDAPLVRLLARSIREVYGIEPKPIGIGGGTVGAYLRNEGIDSAVWGRMDDTAHQPNEYAVLAYILGDAQVMALLMLEP